MCGTVSDKKGVYQPKREGVMKIHKSSRVHVRFSKFKAVRIKSTGESRYHLMTSPNIDLIMYAGGPLRQVKLVCADKGTIGECAP